MQTFFIYFINHKTQLIQQSLSAASVWGISQYPGQCNSLNLTFFVQVAEWTLSYCRYFRANNPEADGISVTLSEATLPSSATLPQPPNNPSLEHPESALGSSHQWGKISHQTDSPILSHQSATCECHIPAPNSFLLAGKERVFLHLWNTVESPSSFPGTPARRVRALQCNNAVCSQHNWTPTATKLEKNIKNWAGNYSYTTPNPACSLALWTFPSSHPTVQQALFWWTHWDQPPPSLPQTFHILKTTKWGIVPRGQSKVRWEEHEGAERQNRRRRCSARRCFLWSLTNLLPKLP